MRTQNKFKIFSQINIQLKINVMSVTDLFEAFATNNTDFSTSFTKKTACLWFCKTYIATQQTVTSRPDSSL